MYIISVNINHFLALCPVSSPAILRRNCQRLARSCQFARMWDGFHHFHPTQLTFGSCFCGDRCSFMAFNPSTPPIGACWLPVLGPRPAGIPGKRPPCQSLFRWVLFVLCYFFSPITSQIIEVCVSSRSTGVRRPFHPFKSQCEALFAGWNLP